jgi:hypothetical protein
MSDKQIITVRVCKETVSYLKEVAQYNERSFSFTVNRVLSHAAEKHRAASTGNQASLDLLRVLGSAPGQATKRDSDS